MKAARITSRQPSTQALSVSRVASNGEAVKRTGAPSAAASPIWSHNSKRDIARHKQQGRRGPAPVAHSHPALADAARPAEPVPPGKRDSADPARLLAHRGVEIRGEVAAAGDDGARSGGGGNAHEHRPQTERAEPQPQLIILGQAGRGKGQVVMLGGEPVERVALDCAAHSREGNRRADRFAHDQFLDVALRELVGIMAADPARRGVGQGQDGQLDQRGALDQPVEQPELERVDEVLGVVEHDSLGARRARRFVGDQRTIEEVEAVGLGRRSVGGDRDRADARVGNGGDGRGGGRVVAIKTDVEAVIVMFETLERGAQHGADHRRLVPRGDQHREPAGAVGRGERIGEGARIAAVDGYRAPPCADEIDEVDQQIVEREEQRADRRKERDFAGHLGQEQSGAQDGQDGRGRKKDARRKATSL